MLLKLWVLLRNQFGWTSELAVTGVAEIDGAIPEFC